MKRGKTLICGLLVMALLVIGVCPAVIFRAEEHYAVSLLKKLGLYSASDDTAAISGFDCGLLILMTRNLQGEALQVTGDLFYSSVSQLSISQANQVKAYFSAHPEYGMESFFGGSVAFVPTVPKTPQILQTTIPSYQIYQAALVGLGYQPGTDFLEDKTSILNFAVQVGFRGELLLDTEAATYEDWAEILYEALFLNTKKGEILLKQMCTWNDTLAKAVEKNGIFADVDMILPEFTAGALVNGSGQTGGTKYTEYQVQYAKVTQSALTSYAAEVKAAGWTLQAAFSEEVGSTGSSTVYYTFQRMIQTSSYFAVLALDTKTNVLTIWYAY